MIKKVIKFPTKKNYKNEDFFLEYTSVLTRVLNSIDLKQLKKISGIILKTIIKNKQIFVAGNGGSGAIANHFLCDFNKGIKISSKEKLKPKIISLSSSPEIITAIANDIHFNEIFRYQADNYIQKNDILIVFSCSGKSKNIINLVNFCNKKQIRTIYITGFNEEKKFNKNVIHLNLNCKNYGITEDAFSSLMHVISQYIRFQYNQNEIL